jgi:hypothetical protein
MTLLCISLFWSGVEWNIYKNYDHQWMMTLRVSIFKTFDFYCVSNHPRYQPLHLEILIPRWRLIVEHNEARWQKGDGNTPECYTTRWKGEFA